MTVADLTFPLAAATSLAVVALVLIRGPRDRHQTTLALGMAAFAVEALVASVLVGWTETPEDRGRWLRLLTTCNLLVLLPWAALVGGFLAAPRTPSSRRVHWALGLGGAVIALGSAMVWLREPFLVAHLAGSFYAARLTDTGAQLALVQVIGTIAILAGLETCLRTADRDARWRIKYLVLGLGVLFLVRFYLLSHMLLFHVLLASYVTTQAAALALATVPIGVSVLRAPLGGAAPVVSRAVVFRSAVVALLGLYLFVVGGLGWLLNRAGLSEELFWGSLVVFAGATVAGALVLSEDLRWRLKRLIGRHIYHSKYDYRAQWITFTRRLGSTVAVEDLAPQLLTATADAIGTAKGALYVAGDDGYHLAATLEVHDPPPTLDQASPLVRRACQAAAPLPLSDAERPAWFPQAAILIPLTWQGSSTGIMLLATERTNAPYTAEDLEFLATVGVQVAAAIVTTRLSEMVARSREFEAFHRVTSFIVHDIKNAVSSLSMLTGNARQHFHDPEFQRDAITTLSRTVERMHRLLQRLASAADVPQFSMERLDLATLLADRIAPLVRKPHVRLTLDLQPAPMLGDPESVERVLQNLVINALEALDGEGEVALRSTRRGTVAICEVSDTGSGMSPEFQRRSLFVPFRSSKKGGWGIGLYHAREIVHAHGGSIEVQSEEGRGTTFIVSFPCADRDAEPARS